MAYNERGHAGDLDDNRGQESAKAESDAGSPGGGGDRGGPIADPGLSNTNREEEASADSARAGAETRSSRADSVFSDDSSDWPRWDDDLYRRRRRLSLLARIWSWFRGGRSASGPGAADELREIAREAYGLHKEFANQLTAHVAAHYGHAELSGLSAREQVEYLRENWREASAREAQALANRGELVIAALAKSGGPGHTAVVTPGEGAAKTDGDFYPNVTAGGAHATRSDGTKTAGDVWSARDRQHVRYFRP